MYQLPVGNIEKIRRARKAVKNVLGEIGLEDCQNLLKVRRAVPAANVSTNMKRGSDPYLGCVQSLFFMNLQ